VAAVAEGGPVELPPVSLVIATRDRPVGLVRCLTGLIEGDRPPAEIVIVDQGVRSVEHEAAETVRTRSVLRYIRRVGGGVASARNAGVLAATSDLVAFTDDDCVPAPGWLSALVQACAPPVAGATGRVLPLQSSRTNLVPMSSRTRDEPRVYGPGGVSPPWEVGTGGNLLLRRHVLEDVGGFDERFGPGARFKAAEDIELLQRVLTAEYVVAYAPEAVVYHEMKTRRARLASRVPYGFGMGAFVASRVGRDHQASKLARPYARMQATTLVRGIRSGSPRVALEPVLLMFGFAGGFVSYLSGRHRERRD
jgi:GT2 family glycosyltransferase